MRVVGFLAITGLVVTLLLAACATPTASPIATKPSTGAAATMAPAVPTLAQAVATSVPAAATKPAAAATAVPAANIKRGGTLRVGNQNDIGNMDPQINLDNNFHLQWLFNTIVDLKIESPTPTGKWNPKPSLAESWEVNGKVFTFRLRKGVKFHDGSDWNAEAFKFNIERMQNNPKSSAASLLGAFDTVDIVDPYTVKLNLKFPYAPTLTVLSQAGNFRTYIVSKTAVEKWGDEFTRHPVGTGPMQFVDWRPGDQANFKRFDGYFEMGADGKPLPYLDAVVSRFIADDTVRLLEIRSGNLDVIDIISAKDIPATKADPNLLVDEKPWTGNLYRVGFNLWPEAKTIFYNNVKLRQAVAYGTDRDSLAKVLGMSAGKVWQYPVTEGKVGYDPSIMKYTYDPAKAKQLMTEAGYPNGVDTIQLVQQRALDQQQAQMLKQMWDAIGLRTEMDVIERIAANYKIRAHDYKFYTLRGAVPHDPDLLFSPGYTKTGSTNYAGWQDDAMQKCVEDGRSTYDEKERQAIYVRCIQMGQEQLPYIWNWLQTWNDVISTKVKGWEPDNQGFFILRGAWLDK
jgi:peptide/nickel transport system substrate-binding protein